MGLRLGCRLFSAALSWMTLLQFLTRGHGPVADASPAPSLVPRVKPSYSFGRTFLGLDKCNACIGTSICKKFFKEEIRFDNWPASHLKPPPDHFPGYSANYTDDSKSWRLVEISRLIGKDQNELSDQKICTSVSLVKTCSIERVLRKTERFQKWLKARRLTPALVQGLPSLLLRCPTQRLLDRIVRRYAEVPDAGSVYMDHFTDRDKLRLLYTLSVNAHPVLLQVFPGAEGWPFPKYLGSCGRLLVSTSTTPLLELSSGPPDRAADLGHQLLGVIEFLRHNDWNYFFYFTRIHAGTFGVFDNGHLFIRDASSLGVIDRQEGKRPARSSPEPRDIFSCLAADCQSDLPSCNTVQEHQSLVLVCRELLPKLLEGKFPKPVQEEIDALLDRCGDSSLDGQTVIGGARRLMDILKSLRTCDARFAYRYPDCKYSEKY
ncbi:divergent protein kinase domain 2B [Ornithorhynchus anatinus]|uniref:Divergent protein kinase domain 2B n=1 Tax=Ornithorhynchus anatinus TaxID=9258 RepID=A0A6I8PQJ7_ORNAN|nr:divergent protein kinase domain 2B [Ornithorhynchus anatinus]XP_028939162.1 divergent protein kinase domain 2B [Ornithorhynchus anatinus]